MSETQPSAAASSSAPVQVPAAGRKPRSKAERVVVWGVIAVGLALIATEGMPRLRYTLDFNALEGAVAQQDSTDRGVVESQAKELVTHYSSVDSQTGLRSNELASPRVDAYTYNGLLSKRTIYVYYGHTLKGEEPEVLAVLREPVAFVEATEPTDDLQPQALDLTPVPTDSN
ncbi:MAG: hypothetical protein JNG89_21700 [Planctomycetaceae bacterium]|nr:hypothetical protein [Planctomycetaceae bacterium]